MTKVYDENVKTKKSFDDDDDFYDEEDEYNESDESDESCLKLFKGKDKPDHACAWELYQQGLDFNANIKLEENVRVNENFYIGKQWEGVETNGLPTPTINILKRVLGFISASITSDNVKAVATSYSNVPNKTLYKKIIKAINDEFIYITDRNRLTYRIRDMVRHAGIDGDSYLYSYWDADEFTGMKIEDKEIKGAIKTEIVENTRMFFGNPTDKDVQSQPWIQIIKREILRNVRIKAKENGNENWRRIVADEDESNKVDDNKRVDGMVTVIYTFWKDDDDGNVWCYESTRTETVTEPFDLGIKLYPIVGMSWDEVPDCYHGQSMITGLIPNQVFINKAYAMTMLNIMKAGFSTVLFDATRISKWTNRVGGAIPINGGDVNTAARILDPPPINPQVYQYIQAAIEDTEKSLGATSVALGDTRPDNTSAIISLQRAAATPSENTKQNIYECTKQLYEIYLEFMGEYYGERFIDVPAPQQVLDAVQFAQAADPGLEMPEEIPEKFDFSILKNYRLFVKVDTGSSSYYSEIMALTNLSNLLTNGQITIVDYLERVPNDYIPDKESLLNAKRKEMQEMKAMQQQAMMPQTPPPMPTGGAPTIDSGPMDVKSGAGYGNLQRAINKAGDTEGIV